MQKYIFLLISKLDGSLAITNNNKQIIPKQMLLILTIYKISDLNSSFSINFRKDF